MKMSFREADTPVHSEASSQEAKLICAARDCEASRSSEDEPKTLHSSVEVSPQVKGDKTCIHRRKPRTKKKELKKRIELKTIQKSRSTHVDIRTVSMKQMAAVFRSYGMKQQQIAL
jgi:hypothetical protein